MGGMKAQYRTREQAVKQLCWHAKRGRGGTFTIVVCPKDPQVLDGLSSGAVLRFLAAHMVGAGTRTSHCAS